MPDDPFIQYSAYGGTQNPGADQRKQERADQREEQRNPGEADRDAARQAQFDRQTLSRLAAFLPLLEKLDRAYIAGKGRINWPVVDIGPVDASTTIVQGGGGTGLPASPGAGFWVLTLSDNGTTQTIAWGATEQCSE